MNAFKRLRSALLRSAQNPAGSSSNLWSVTILPEEATSTLSSFVSANSKGSWYLRFGANWPGSMTVRQQHSRLIHSYVRVMLLVLDLAETVAQAEGNKEHQILRSAFDPR